MRRSISAAYGLCARAPPSTTTTLHPLTPAGAGADETAAAAAPLTGGGAAGAGASPPGPPPTRRHTPVRLSCCALMSTLCSFCRSATWVTLYTHTWTPSARSRSALATRLAVRWSLLSLASSLRRACAASRAAICARTRASMADGFATADSPSARIKLDSFTFGSGGGTNPARMASCLSRSAACRRCVRSFLRSFAVSGSGCGGGGGRSAGGCTGGGCST
mmetsp:Transcript_25699/g.66460  ORF Transcript_25699/g.66460 Transcript_25699/m.66460 type:complete len:220 (+) Transcript_25699:492-1151(+)